MLCTVLEQLGFSRVNSGSRRVRVRTPAPEISIWSLVLPSRESGQASQLSEVHVMGRSRTATYVRHFANETFCVHASTEYRRLDDLSLWFKIHTQTLSELERDLAQWEVRFMLRLADPSADMALMSQMSRFRLSSLRVCADRLNQAIPASATSPQCADFTSRVDSLIGRLHRAFELLATGATGRMLEIERENTIRGERLTKTVTIMTCLFLAPSLVAAIIGAAIPGNLSSLSTIILASCASAFLALSLLPGFHTTFIAHFRRFVAVTITVAVICAITASALFHKHASAPAYATVALFLSLLTFLVTTRLRSRVNLTPPSPHPPSAWSVDYARLRNDLQRPS
jgi:hypothetical protein